MQEPLRPSMLPLVALSPLWKPTKAEYDDETLAMFSAGTSRHEALAELLTQGESAMLDLIPDDDRESVLWAWEQVKIKAPANAEFRVEVRNTVYMAGFDISGTPDIIAHGDGPSGKVVHLFDLKGRAVSIGYKEQLAAYAWHAFSLHKDIDSITVTVIYSTERHVTSEQWTRSKVESILLPIFAARTARLYCNPSAACQRCAWSDKCHDKNRAVKAVMRGRPDYELPSFKTDEIKTPEQIANAYTIAKSVGDWAKGIMNMAREKVIKEGLQLPGYALKSKQGNAYVADVTAAFERLGIPQDKFLKCCSLTLSTSKKKPDKVGIYDVFAEVNGLKVSQAKKSVGERLGNLLKRGAPKFELRADTESGDEEDSDETN